MKKDLRIGVHNSIEGGVCNAVFEAESLGTNTMQLFLHSPRTWQFKGISQDDARRFKVEVDERDIKPVIVHSSYLIHPLSENSDLLGKSKKLLSEELKYSDLITAEYYVIHIRGNKKHDLEVNTKNLFNFFRFLPEYKHVKLLLENSASGLTSNISNLVYIFNGVKEISVVGGICIDTAHLYQAGYDITKKEGIRKFLSELGDKNLVKLIHLNDSKTEVGSYIDKHEHIGVGRIGIDGFKTFFTYTNFHRLPIILETPRPSVEYDIKNLRAVKEDIFGVRISRGKGKYKR
ncbi:MAG: deoxyribonuclease IV [Candidatus Hydrogenedentes bacterium]|nr:deoxyribonuclease IV [Candidatus Hydrogenedentota bacterium]